MNDTVLIVTHRRGFEADFVIDRLRDSGKKIFRFNTDAGSVQSRATFSSNSESNKVVLYCDGVRIEQSQIAAGWCQQLHPFIGQQPESERACLQQTNLVTLQSACFNLLETSWLNSPHDVQIASNKVSQLAKARMSGLKIPHTVVSNDPREIRAFAKSCQVVAKNLATPWLTSGNQTRAAYTKVIDPASIPDDALSFAPVIYQQYWKRARDIRVVMIDGQAYTATCTPRDDQQEDIRRNQSTGETYTPCILDEEILTKLRDLLEQFGLHYCAADFMETKDGELYFLELNTCGSWWWIDRLYNGKIRNALAEALINRVDGHI